MEEKEFGKWMDIKKILHRNSASNYFRVGYKEGDIFWMSIGVNVGDEQDGKGRLFTRPVLVVKGYNRHIFLGVPLTSKLKTGKFYYSFRLPNCNNYSTALLSQMRILDAARISGRKRLGMVNKTTLLEIKKLLCKMIM